MDEVENKKAMTVAKKSSHVRFTDAELAQLERDERDRGLTIPFLLKEAYFHGRPTAILMNHEEQKAFLNELIRQGTNLNQIARRVNAGIMEGMQQEIANIRRALAGLVALVNAKVTHAKLSG